MFQLFSKKEELLTTQDLIDIDSINMEYIVTQNSVIGALSCPMVNTKMMTNKQNNHLLKQFANVVTTLKNHQIKRQSEAVDLSDEIEKQTELRDSESNFVKKQLRNGYIQVLKDNSEVTTNYEKKNYIILEESFTNKNQIEDKVDILLERLREGKADLAYIIENGYKATICSGKDVVKILEIDVNSYSSRVNRFMKESPVFIINEDEKSDYDKLVEQYKAKGKTPINIKKEPEE